MYRPEWWPKRDRNDVGVLDLAQALHEQTTGASDPLPHSDIADIVESLTWLLENWVESDRSYDHAVKVLVFIALKDFQKKSSDVAAA